MNLNILSFIYCVTCNINVEGEKMVLSFGLYHSIFILGKLRDRDLSEATSKAKVSDSLQWVIKCNLTAYFNLFFSQTASEKENGENFLQ